MRYYTLNSDGSIAACADEYFEVAGCTCLTTEREIVCAYDGLLYFADEAPVEPPAAIRRREIQAEIAALESSQTPRMTRGAALGLPDDVARLQEIEEAISGLRAELQAWPEPE
jgi:hypothetical protein